MNNEKQFFKDIAELEPVEYSLPLTVKEIEQIYFDVAMQNRPNPLIDFVRRIENAHGIGIKNGRIKN